MRFEQIQNGDISLRVAIDGKGPLVLFVHGFPELWYSWRHQLPFFAQRGFTAAAMDVRGYGGSDKPHAIDAYTLRELTSDVVAVANALSDDPAVIVGHDWGSPIAWHTALLHPDRVRAVAGLSVPYLPSGDTSILDLFEKLYEGKFFYQLYFQQEGPPEQEFEQDLKKNLKRLHYAWSGTLPVSKEAFDKPRNASFFDGIPEVEEELEWMADEDLQVYADAFKQGGMRGPLNRYRAQRMDFDDLKELRGKHIAQPAAFIGGSHDLVRKFAPGMDLYSMAGSACDDFRGTTIIEGAGHWVQQQRPQETNQALLEFLQGL